MQYAFCDESGAFGFSFEKENVSTHFLIAAIIVDENDLDKVYEGAEKIREQYFQSGEMKSSKLKNIRRRCIILENLNKLPFNIYLFVADKRKVYEQSGLHYKPSFYKFLNQYVYRELHRSFQHLTIIADETGSNDYMKSFVEYVRKKNPPLTLFDQFDIQLDDSKKGVFIQIADIVSGSLAFSYDEKKKAKAEGSNFKTLLGKKILHIEEFPKDYKDFSVASRYKDEDKTDLKIAEICFRRAMAFKKAHEEEQLDENVQKQIIVLDYLLFRFANNSIRTYIPTKELITCLEKHGYEHMSLQSFRNKVIAKLRDNGVIISSSPKGYKIPAKLQEVEDFVIHCKGIIEPMVSRLKLCHDTIKLGSNGSIDLLRDPHYSELKRILDIE